MIVATDSELEGLKKIGRIVAEARDEMIAKLRAGMTTAELDSIGAAVFKKYGARSAPQAMYNFPGCTCISVNDEAAHGIPGLRVIQAGDMVNIDVSAEYGGYYADTGASVVLEPASELKRRLCECAAAALYAAIGDARAGCEINVIGKAIANEAEKYGFTVIRNLCGHGIGRSLHEEPREILNYFNPFQKERLTEGLVLAIETFISSGANYVVQQDDGWTLTTPQQALVAQFEHTVVITRGEAIITTVSG